MRIKKGISVILVVLIVLGGLNGLFIRTEIAYAAVAFAGGTGTDDDPYLIENVAQLDEVRNNMSASFKLNSNIDLSTYASGEGWMPIGASGNEFKGKFNGNGYEISNLTINRPTMDRVGLFGLIGFGLAEAGIGSVENIRLEDVQIIGGSYVGGLAGWNNGTVSNSSVTGSVYGQDNVGGLLGRSQGVINSSYSTASVTGLTLVGGLIGLSNSSQSSINNSYATGSVSGQSQVGGLVGEVRRTIINKSYTAGIVSGTASVGGLVGSVVNGGTFNNSFYDSTTTQQSDTGKGTGKTTEDMKLAITYTDWDLIDIWGIDSSQNNGYPFLKMGSIVGTVFAGGTGSERDPFLIATADQLNEVRNYLKFSFKLVDHIDLSTYASGEGWLPIGNEFRGRFDGNGYKINNLTINRPDTDTVGLFVLFAGSIVKNVKLENVHVTGKSSVGGLVGNNQGAISYSSVTGSVYGESGVGGIVGSNVGGGINTSYSLADVYGSSSVGGFVAHNTETGVITNSYATGSVNGAIDPGGLTGINIGGTINYSFYDMGTTGQTDTGKGVGQATVDMKILGTFTEWDLPGIWDMNALINNGYPYINALPPAAIAGITVPVAGETPVATVASTDTYTAVITWSPTHATFAADTDYTATITLTPEAGYTLSGVAANYFTVVGASATNSVHSGVVTALFSTIRTIPTGVISGVSLPVTGEPQLKTVSQTSSYAAVLVWYPTDATFQANTLYTARAVLIPNTSFTLTGVSENAFTVAGATTTNASNSGVITAVFPRTAVVIATSAIEGVTAPISGAAAVTAVASTEYNAAIVWSPTTASTFADTTAYTATITLTPKAGYTLTGVGANFFTVAGATSTTNAINSGVITAVFPATAIATVIAPGAIAGVTAPVTGEVPDTTIASTTEYTAAIAWSPVATTFAGATAYTATITLIANPGYTLTGVGANFFTVADAIATNTANAGVITAVFPATAPSTAATLTSTIGTVSMGGTANETITNVPNGTTLAVLKDAITPAAHASVDVYNADGITEAVTLKSGKKVVVTAQDGITMVTYTVTVNAATTSSDEDSPPLPSTVTSTDGTLTLPAGGTGVVSLEEEVTVSIPADATDKELRITIEKVLNTQSLLTNQEVLLSSVFEILKNFPENFNSPVTLTFIFDPVGLKSNQKAVVCYYDELDKIWVEVGGVVSGDTITVDVDHFTKYALMAVDGSNEPATETPTDTPTVVSFSDISGHWAEASIKQAVSDGIVIGYPDGTFKPNLTVTRAEFAVMLMHAWKPLGDGVQLTFTDTASIGAWAKKSVEQAVQAGIIKGYVDGAFGPNAEITRAEMASMIAIAMGHTVVANAVTGFADEEDIPSWVKGAVAYLKQTGTVQGKGDNEYAPQDHATRAEAVTILVNMLGRMSK